VRIGHFLSGRSKSCIHIYRPLPGNTGTCETPYTGPRDFLPPAAPDRPADVLEVDVDAARAGGRQLRGEIGGPVIDRRVEAEAALLDEWRLDDWLALFHPEKARYLIPSPEDLSDDPATTLHLVNDSRTTLAGRVGRLKDSRGDNLSKLLLPGGAALAVQTA
jgi:hypothetical protein